MGAWILLHAVRGLLQLRILAGLPMNIFVLDSDPTLAAQYQHNKHVVKMILESAQLLCGPLNDAPYKRTHFNHPCAIWTRQTRANYLWLIEHGLALADEYTYRYGKIHASKWVINHCASRVNEIPGGSMTPHAQAMTPHAQAMPDEYRRFDTVEAYRAYYIGTKLVGAVWTNRERPKWARTSSE